MSRASSWERKALPEWQAEVALYCQGDLMAGARSAGAERVVAPAGF